MDRTIISAVVITTREVLQDEESSSDDDEELAVIIFENLCRGEQVLRPRIELYAEDVVHRYNDAEFKAHFRMNRTTFDVVLQMVQPFITKQNRRPIGASVGRHTISPRKQLLVAIWMFATPDSYRSVCDRFNIGKATAMRSLRRVTRALNQLVPNLIKWPSANEAAIIAAGFHSKKGFPKVLGAIDGTHIGIAAPNENAEAYVNRKGFHSIQLQVVCDHRMLFIHAYTGQVGSVHDMRVYNLSGLPEFCNEVKFPDNTHLIGDAAYAIHKNMMVPFRNNGHLNRMQNNYNYCHSSTRMTVERSLGLLKGRFRNLLDRLPMTRTDLIPAHIMACCALHNICILQNDLIDIPILVNCHELPIPPANDNRLERLEGIQKRSQIVLALPMRLHVD